MKAYQSVEQRLRDKDALAYEGRVRTSQGILFDVREKSIFADTVRTQNMRRVLDLGSGTGRITQVLAPHVGRLVALDLSMESLRVLQAKYHLP